MKLVVSACAALLVLSANLCETADTPQSGRLELASHWEEEMRADPSGLNSDQIEVVAPPPPGQETGQLAPSSAFPEEASIEPIFHPESMDGLPVSQAPIYGYDPADKDQFPVDDSVRILAIVGFLGLLFTVASVIESLLNRLKIPVPISVALFMLGIFISWAVEYVSRSTIDNKPRTAIGSVIVALESMDQSLIFFIILPICLYESASHISFNAFKQVSLSALLLAGPGVIINIAIIATFIRYYFSSVYTWPAAVLVGSILSATDPVAVVAALKELGAPARLEVLLEGESLLNDGTAVVFFEIFLSIVVGRAHSIWHFILEFFRLALLGPILGFAAGILAYFWLRMVRGNVVIQVSFVVGMFYFLAFSAEHVLSSSAVLTIVIFGFTVAGFAKAGFSRVTLHLHEHFMMVVGCMANQSLFIVAGMLACKFFRNFQFEWIMLLHISIVYMVCMIARLVSLVLLAPLLSRMGYGMTLKEGFVLLWGCLRGGVALALCIAVEDNHRIPLPIRQHATFYIASFTMMTLVINGTTFSIIFRALNVYALSKARKMLFKQACSTIEEKFREGLAEFGEQWFVDNSILRTILESRIVPNLDRASLMESGELKLDLADPFIEIPAAFENQGGVVFEEFCSEEHQANFVKKTETACHSHRNTRLGCHRASQQLVDTLRSMASPVGKSVVPSFPGSEVEPLLTAGTFSSERIDVNETQTSIGEVLEVILHSIKLEYERLYEEHAIEAEAVLILNNAADCGIDVIHKKQGLRRNDLAFCVQSPFTVQWAQLQRKMYRAGAASRQLSVAKVKSTPRSKETWETGGGVLDCFAGGNCNFLRRLFFSGVARDVEVLFAYITAYEDMRAGFSEGALQGSSCGRSLKDLIGKQLAEQVDSLIVSAKQILMMLMRMYPWIVVNAMAKIQCKMLVNRKRALATEIIAESLVFHEDMDKLVERLEHFHASLVRYFPPPPPMECNISITKRTAMVHDEIDDRMANFSLSLPKGIGADFSLTLPKGGD